MSKPGQAPIEYFSTVSPQVGPAFKNFRAIVAEAGPLDRQTVELILMVSFAIAGIEKQFKIHARRAKEHGVAKAMLQHAVTVPIGAVSTAASVITALEWIGDVYAD